MNGRVFIQTFAMGALVLGSAVTLSGCQPSSTSTAGGSTQSAAAPSPAGNGAATSAAPTGGSGGNGGSTGGASNGGSGSGAQGGSGGENTCQTGKVSVKLGATDSGMGHRGMILLFTNTGSTSCELGGYPGATITNSGQYNFAPYVNAQRTLSGYEGGASAVTTVTLAPGATASATLEWEAFPPDGSDPNAANCPGMAGGYLEITPPNTTATSKFDPPTDMCAKLEIHPVVSGTTGRSGS